MKLVCVVPRVDEEASGLSHAVPSLCRHLAARGHEVELSCLAARGDISGVRIDLHPQWPLLSRFAISPSHVRALRGKARVVDVIHNHSLWSMINISSGWVVPGSRAKLVTSPHGTLAPWALNYKRFRKQAFWPLQRRALSRADLLHATSEAEHDDIRVLGFNAPIAVIPVGIDLPELPAAVERAEQRTMLFLGRIHPVKGIDRLLRAWQRLEVRCPDWRLVVAGRGEAKHERDVKALAEALRLRRVVFPGPIYGAHKSQAYFDADLCVFPSHTENFGSVVAESLAHACPVVVSRGAPWPGLVDERCGWWVGNDVPTLAAALEAAMALPGEERAEMGLRGRAWMERAYGWASVAQEMEAAYRWILGGSDKPSSVRCD